MNRILRQEILIKPCRCTQFYCDQNVDLSVRRLRTDPSGTPLESYKQTYLRSDQVYEEVSSRCTMRVNVNADLEVVSADVM